MLGKVLGGLGRILIIAGVVVLGFVGYQLWGTGLESARGQDELTEGLARDLDLDEGDGEAADLEVSQVVRRLSERDPASAAPMPPPPEGDALGVIEIPRIGMERVVVEGVSKDDLKKGPGRYPGTAMPGQEGNAGIAGHRTTYGAPFNRIDELVPGDEIEVTTAQGAFTYEVVPAPGPEGERGQAWYAVAPTRVEVLDDVGDNRLTLTACHPKYSARERIIVHAVLAEPPAPTPAVVVTPKPDGALDADATETVAVGLDEGLDGDDEALRPALLFGAAAAGLMVLAWALARYLRRWLVYLVAAPGVVVLVWFGYVYMDRYLPAL